MDLVERLSRYCDRAVKGGLIFLLLFTPLAFGSVHPWAFMLMEATCFLLVSIWMSRVLLNFFARSPLRRLAVAPPTALILPFACFVGFLILQLTPLPPVMIQMLSPATYEVYTRSLPGWPERMPYTEWLVLDTVNSSAAGRKASDLKSLMADVPPSEVALKDQSADIQSLRFPVGSWLPLSLASELSKTSLFKLLAYASIFFLVLVHPFETKEDASQSGEQFLRTLLLTILGAGVLVALLGLAQHFTWNGKILWFFVPQDWSGPMLLETPRASGPFINSDHFANYLTLIFPLALISLIAQDALTMPTIPLPAWMRSGLFGISALVLLMGILLSLSRAGWISIGLGASLVLYFLPGERRQQLFGGKKRKLSHLIGVVTLALLFVGSSGRSQIDRQLEQTVIGGTSLRARLELWRDSVGIVRDFPLLGVGMGAWPEVFPRYQRPPWTSLFIREAHNDYVQSLAELGTLGSGLLIWFLAVACQLLYRGLAKLSVKDITPYAALLASLGVMAFHETVDFNLQIPANAFLFSVLFGLALRLALQSRKTAAITEPPHQIRSIATLLGAVVTIVIVAMLGVAALQQERIGYPYNLQEPTTIAEAQQTLLAYPALASTHVALFTLTAGQAPLARRLEEIKIALWLDPREPFAHDLYAQGLRHLGREEEGLQEISHSVSLSPQLSTHEGFTLETIDALSDSEQQAIEKGLRQALAAGDRDAAFELGAFYSAVRRFTDAGEIYESAMHPQDDEETQRRALLQAGEAFIRAGAPEHAGALLRRANALDPRDVRPYRALIQAYATQEDLDGAKTVMRDGMQNGAEPLPLLLALADAAQKMGNYEEARSALTEALKRRGAVFEVLLALGQVYLQENEFEHAAAVLRKAAKAQPDDAAVFSALARAEEGCYQFAAAQDAYEKAVELNPQDAELWRRYEAFRNKLVASR